MISASVYRYMASTPTVEPANQVKTNSKSIAEYQKDIIDIYGKLYYIGDTLTPSYLKKMNIRMNRQLKTINHLLEPKDSTIYTKDDFKKEYIQNANADTDADVAEDMIELCKKYLQLGQTYIKDCIKDGKDIVVDNEMEKDQLVYILTTRKKQLESDTVNTILSLHGRSYLQLHDIIVAKIKVNSTKKSVDNESNIMDFLLFYVWNILQNQKKQPANAKTAWNTASPKKTWHTMILEIRQKTIEDVINAFGEIQKANDELQGLSNVYKNTQPITTDNIKEYLTNLLTIIEGYKVSKADDNEVEEGAEEKGESDDEIATLASEAFSKYLSRKPPALINNIELTSTSKLIPINNKDAEYPVNNEPRESLMGGGSLLPTSFFARAIQPIMHYLHMNHSIYSFITDIVPSYNIIGDMQQLHHICSSITNEKQYGFYRIKHIPSELFTHIQQLIDCSITYTSHNGTHYSASHCNTDGDYLYFLCLDGNIAFTEDVTEKKQIKEQTAVRTFFQEKTLYLLYSPKKEVRMSNYMRDPYYVYDINYDDINHDTHQIRIRNIDTLLNKQDVPLGNYLTVESKKLVDICQLELSLIHQLNHLIVV